MPEYRDFRAWILYDGVPLPEYSGAPDPCDDRTYTCWVPSELGKAFTVRWTSSMGGVCDNLGIVSVDGVRADGRLDIAHRLTNPESTGVRLNDGSVRPYVFAPTVLTDDDSYLGIQQSPDMSELGNITIKIYLVRAERRFLSYARSRKRDKVELYNGAIHETSKKICDHRVTLGDAARPRGSYIPTGPRRSVITNKPYDRSDKGPYVTFCFKYRPMSYLKAQGLLSTDKEIVEISRGPRAMVTPSKKRLLIERFQTPCAGTPVKEDIATPLSSLRTPQKGLDVTVNRKRELSEMSASARNVFAASVAAAAADAAGAGTGATAGAGAVTPAKAGFSRSGWITIKQSESTRKMMLARKVSDRDNHDTIDSQAAHKRMKLEPITPMKSLLR